uniref:Uncharacterized protein n=1 Tax=Arundo donax TaxID=35708 RepID=A0A0A9GU12_ARUDO
MNFTYWQIDRQATQTIHIPGFKLKKNPTTQYVIKLTTITDQQLLINKNQMPEQFTKLKSPTHGLRFNKNPLRVMRSPR